MHSFNLIAATGLLAASAVQAAPRAMSFDAVSPATFQTLTHTLPLTRLMQSEASTHAYAVDEKDAFSEIVPRGMEWARSAQEQVPTDCPAPVLIVTTTTVDVTVYVTPSPTAEDMTTPMTTDTPRVTISIQNMTVPEPCDDDTTAGQTSTKPQSSSASMTMSSSSSSTSAMSSSSASTSSTPSRVTISIIPEHTTTPAPSEMETPPPCDEGSTFSYFTSTTAAPAPTQSSSDCVIDTAVTPVSTSTMSATPTTASAQPTKTQCVHDEPTGKPTDQTMYCGIHGKPAGTYFIAEFIENKPEEPVTEEGCYQFCDVSLPPHRPAFHKASASIDTNTMFAERHGVYQGMRVVPLLQEQSWRPPLLPLRPQRRRLTGPRPWRPGSFCPCPRES